jgi:hypothetical protein
MGEGAEEVRTRVVRQCGARVARSQCATASVQQHGSVANTGVCTPRKCVCTLGDLNR